MKTKWWIISIVLLFIFFGTAIGLVCYQSGYNIGWDKGYVAQDAVTVVEMEMETEGLEEAGYFEVEIQGWIDTQKTNWNNWYWNSGYKEGYIDGFYGDMEPLKWFKIYNFKEEK